MNSILRHYIQPDTARTWIALLVFMGIQKNISLEKEKDIYREVAKKEGKPENILDRIAEGKLKKYYEENCLLNQAYIKDNAKNIGDLLAEFNKKYSSASKISTFLRFHLSDENK